MSTERPSGTGLVAAHARSQRAFYAALGSGSAGARLAQWPGVQATMVPVRPWFSIFNSVLFDEPHALRAVLPELACAYRDSLVHAWRVWVSPENREAQESLVKDGYSRTETSPCRMAATVDAIDLAPRSQVDLHPSPTWEDVARCNDRAYGILDDCTPAGRDWRAS